MDIETYANKINEEIVGLYNAKEEEVSSDIMRRLEKYILLEVVDARWRENLKTLDSLKEGIYLRSYGQKDPIVEYKILSGELYNKMLATIKQEVSSYMFKIKIRERSEEELEVKRQPTERVVYSHGNESEDEINKQRSSHKIGRNDLCPCGSGKKYKKCCGRAQ